MNINKMIFLISQNIHCYNKFSFAKLNMCFRSQNSLGKPQNIYNIPKIRTYTQNIEIIKIEKQLDSLQSKLKIMITQILTITSSKNKTRTKEKLTKIKEINLNIRDILFQIEFLQEQLLNIPSEKDDDEPDFIEIKRKNYKENKKRQENDKDNDDDDEDSDF